MPSARNHQKSPQKRPARKSKRGRGFSQHHRRPKSQGGGREVERLPNISKVKESQHRAWHCLFGNKTPDEIVAIVNDLYIDPCYEVLLLVRRRE